MPGKRERRLFFLFSQCFFCALFTYTKQHIFPSIRFHSKTYFDGEQYDFLASNLIGTRSIPLEQAEELKKRNPYFQYTDYTSSTYLKHWPVEEIERDYMMHLAMAPAAILKASISPETTEFSVVPYVFPKNEITRWYS